MTGVGVEPRWWRAVSELLAGRLDDLDIGGHSRLTRIVGISSCSLTVAASGNIPPELSVRLEDSGAPGMDAVAHPRRLRSQPTT